MRRQTGRGGKDPRPASGRPARVSAAAARRCGTEDSCRGAAKNSPRRQTGRGGKGPGPAQRANGPRGRPAPGTGAKPRRRFAARTHNNTRDYGDNLP